MDSDAHRLYVAHATKVVVIDTESESVVGEIPDVRWLTRVRDRTGSRARLCHRGRAGKVVIVDLKTLPPWPAVTAGENPDAILYEPVHQEVYAFNHTGKSVTVFDAKTGEVRATIPLGRYCGVRRARSRGRPHLQQPGRHEPAGRHRYSRTKVGDLADRARRRGHRPGASTSNTTGCSWGAVTR